MDSGTLYQLRNVINRRNVVKNPANDVTACEEFFVLVVEAHIVTAAMTIFGMSAIDYCPGGVYFPDGFDELDASQQHQVFMLAVKEVVNKFVNLSFCQEDEHDAAVGVDHVQAYASDLLSLGLLLMEFLDGICEGEGQRIIHCWRYFLLLFKAANRVNYSIEAFSLLVHYQFLLPPRIAMQLMWSRTVNTHGRPGKNIACDIHMEHLNREAKKCITGLGANITDEAVQRIGRSIGHIVKILKHFDDINDIKQPSSRHSRQSCEKDMHLLLTQLHDVSGVFDSHPGRAHSNFPKHQASVTSIPKLKEWMGKQLQQIIT